MRIKRAVVAADRLVLIVTADQKHLPSATMRRTSTMAAARSSEWRRLGSVVAEKGTRGRRIKGLLHCQPSIRWARRGVRRRPFGWRKLT